MGRKSRFLLSVLAAFAALSPLRAEVFELWPWKGGGAPAGISRTGELPGRQTPLYTEQMQVNGVSLEIKASALDTDFPSLLAMLVRMFRPEDLRAGSDAVRVAYRVDNGNVERRLLVDGGPGKPVTLFVIVAPEKLPPPDGWPRELPPLPPGATAERIISFPDKKLSYGSFRGPADDPDALGKALAAKLTAAGWRSLNGDGGSGGMFLHDSPRRILLISFASDGTGVFYTRPY
jgi:hypothetical protein